MRISLIQMRTLSTPKENIVKIKELVSRAVSQGAELIVLPEMCCCEYSNKAFIENAMEEGSEFLNELSGIARQNKIVLVAGSIPELADGGIYNTAYAFDESGSVIAKHRKVHLFDIDIPNRITFKESDTFSAGNSFTEFDTKWGKIGLIICFDIRFPDFIKQNSRQLKMLIVPASFNMTTGPIHWELLFRARAVDNQLFMVGCSTALDNEAGYHSYGHSIITNPWGAVLTQAGTDEVILTQDIDLDEVDEVRGQIPLY